MTYVFKKQHFTFLSSLSLVAFIAIPLVTSAQGLPPLVPVCGNFQLGQKECGYYDFLQLISNLINWMIIMSIPISTAIFAWAGVKYMISPISDQKADAKKMLMNTLIGFIVILSAWLIVSTITRALLSREYNVNSTIDLR